MIRVQNRALLISMKNKALKLNDIYRTINTSAPEWKKLRGPDAHSLDGGNYSRQRIQLVSRHVLMSPIVSIVIVGKRSRYPYIIYLQELFFMFYIMMYLYQV